MTTPIISTDQTASVHPNHRWCACIEGLEEDGPCGFGPTRQDAIDDLNEQMEEASEVEKEAQPEIPENLWDHNGP